MHLAPARCCRRWSRGLRSSAPASSSSSPPSPSTWSRPSPSRPAPRPSSCRLQGPSLRIAQLCSWNPLFVESLRSADLVPPCCFLCSCPPPGGGGPPQSVHGRDVTAAVCGGGFAGDPLNGRHHVCAERGRGVAPTPPPSLPFLHPRARRARSRARGARQVIFDSCCPARTPPSPLPPPVQSGHVSSIPPY